MRILKLLAAASLLAFTPACGGAEASADVQAAEAPAPVEEVRALVRQFGMGGGEKDVAGEQFYTLAQRAAPGLLEITRDPASSVDDLQSVLFIASVYVNDPAIFQALRTRAQDLPDRAERQELTALIDGLASTPGLPYPR